MHYTAEIILIILAIIINRVHNLIPGPISNILAMVEKMNATFK